MIYTNGVILIDSKNDPDALSKAVRKVTRHLEDDRALEAQFLLDDSVSYPCYLIPQGVTYKDLDQALRPHVQMRAINEDVILLPERKSVTEKHYYEQSEMDAMAKSLAAKLVEKRKLEVRKAQLMKEYKADIDALEEQIEELADNHQLGWEERETLCQIKLNFADETRYYVEITDAGSRIVKGEPLETKDYQMRIDVRADLFAHNPNEPEPDSMPEPGEEPQAAPAETSAAMPPLTESYLTGEDNPADGPPPAEDDYAEGEDVDSPDHVI